jgi:ABC-type branched-subunit amino acid transport system ATPase component/ABC-type branched-subunit amino acid transport system permease subunit
LKTEGKQQLSIKWYSYFPIFVVCIVGVFISYLIGPSRYTQRIFLLIVLWTLASSSFNVISGYAGQVVFGYMMFVGTGAYTTVLLFKFLAVSPWLGMWAGVVIAILTALIIGLPTLRLHGAFFAIATIAFPLITFPILNHLGLEELSIPFTGHGASSMQFRDMRFYVLIAISLLAVVLITVRTIESSRFGFALRALNKNETAAEGMGINTYSNKLMAFMLSAGMGALMGTVYSFGLLYIVTTHAVFGLFIMVRILSITIVGGMATVWGPLIAACILVPIGEFLNAQFGDRYPGVQDIIYGIALIAAILYMPEGIWGRIRRSFCRLASKSTVSMKLVVGEDYKQRVLDKTWDYDSLTFKRIQPVTIRNDTNEPILKIEDIDKYFGGVCALGKVNIEVPRGKVTGIIGPNGSGKTTMFNVINGFLPPEKGRIFFEGQDITRLKPHVACKLGIGRTFQIPQVFSNMTVLENIMIGAFNRWGNIDKAYAEAEKIAQQTGFSSRAYGQAVGLTIWETKMLEFSRALATEPKLLLVDEPMAGLNPEESNRIGEMIKVIAKGGVTVIVIEHVVQSLVRIADWMIGLDNGRKVAEGAPQQVISDPHIIEAYLGAKWRKRHATS